MAVAIDPYAEVRQRLLTDFPFYSESQLRIVDKQRIVPFVLKPPQLRFWRALEAQRESGKPGRAIVLKARKIGFSTEGQGLGLHRVTTRPNHNMLTVAQDNKTAEELFRIAEVMYAHLDDHPDLAFLKPEITHQRRQRELHFGEPSRNRLRGALGLNSKMLVDTANEFEAGRGFTYHTLLLSEVASWADLERKLTSLLNAVPDDDPDTLVVMESTAKGPGPFKKRWDDAEAGESEYIAFFSPWFEDDKYRRRFMSEEDREAFTDSIGSGAFGEDEPWLRDLIAQEIRGWEAELDLPPLSEDRLETRVLEHLNWRRYAIVNLAGGDLESFNREYPATPAMAFQVSGRGAFAPLLLERVRKRVEVTDPDATEVVLEKTQTQLRRGRFVAIEVPTGFRELPRNPQARTDLFWRVWEQPKDKGQYLIVVDPASGEERTVGEADFTGVVILDHQTGEQVAEMETRADSDLVAEQILLAALKYSVKPNLPTIVIEMTGGYGTSYADRIWKEYGWRRMYFRKPIDPRRKEKAQDRIGFSTDRHTKPRLVDGMKELLREGSHGIRSLKIVRQMETYQRTKRGGYEAATGAFDDLLMPYMVGEYVRLEVPPRKDRRPGDVVRMVGAR